MEHKDKFERNWMIVFMIAYVLIMLPLPFYYSTKYIPGPWEVPLFLFGWLIHGVVVIALIVIYAKQCLQRPEYKYFEASEPKQQEEFLK